MELGGERDGEVTAAVAAAAEVATEVAAAVAAAAAAEAVAAAAAAGLQDEVGFVGFGWFALLRLHILVWTNQFGQIGLAGFGCWSFWFG